MGTKSSGQREERTRAWTFILYEESAPENWVELIDELHIQWCESPWHDNDLNPTGEVKKKHKHILLYYDGPKSYNQVLEVTQSLNSPIPKRAESVSGLVRYFAHLDNPEKTQYQTSDIIGHGGFDVDDALKPRSRDRYLMIQEILQFCEEYSIMEFVDLVDYARTNRFSDWFPLLCDTSTIFFSAYFKSARNSGKFIKSKENQSDNTNQKGNESK